MRIVIWIFLLIIFPLGIMVLVSADFSSQSLWNSYAFLNFLDRLWVPEKIIWVTAQIVISAADIMFVPKRRQK